MKPFMIKKYNFATKAQCWNKIKAFVTFYLDETLYLKEVNLSYKDFLLKSKPLSWEGHVDYVDFLSAALLSRQTSSYLDQVLLS